MSHGVERAIPCRSCSAAVHVRVLETPEGLPDLITVVWPETCWLGWIWPTEHSGKLEVVGLCSHSCFVAWSERNLAPTLLPPPPEESP